MNGNILALTQIETEKDFLSFVADEATKNGNLSTRGVARCCTVASHTALIDGGLFKSKKLGETLTAHGFHAGELTRDGWPPAAVWLAIEVRGVLE